MSTVKRAISRKITLVSGYVVKLSFGDEYSRGWNSGRINPTPPDNKQQDPSGRLPRQSVRLCWIRGTRYVRYTTGVHTYIYIYKVWSMDMGAYTRRFARPRRISLDERAPVGLQGLVTGTRVVKWRSDQDAGNWPDSRAMGHADTGAGPMFAADISPKCCGTYNDVIDAHKRAAYTCLSAVRVQVRRQISTRSCTVNPQHPGNRP